MIEAIYIGSDESSDFEFGKLYNLCEPDNLKQEWKILVYNADDIQWKIYNSLHSFLKEWVVIDID